jgi:hypothetical protein
MEGSIFVLLNVLEVTKSTIITELADPALLVSNMD